MDEIRVLDVTDENLGDLCRICVPHEKRGDSVFTVGMGEKRKWANEKLQKWGALAKLAYEGGDAVGLIQYEPFPKERVVHIDCIYVPKDEHWQRGIATQLLTSLVDDMKGPKAWFEGKAALALVTKTFRGEKPGQYPARHFFLGRGFKQVGEDPNFLFLPLQEGYSYQPGPAKEIRYVPQEEDKGRALIIYGPSFCPFTYVFLMKAAQAIEEVAPGISIQWINRSEEPAEAEKRGHYEGCIVNAKPISSLVVDAEGFGREVIEALHSHSSSAA